MVIRKRQLLWDWTNSSGPGNPGVPQEMNNVPFGGNSPMSSVINWNAWVPPELKGRAPFRPMVRGMGQVSGGDWGMIENTPYPIILFLNEPERAGISPEQARDIWYKQMLPLRHSKAKKLGSPAVASDPNGQAWLDKWMSLVAKDPPDYLCLHYYSTSADDAIKYITDKHNKYSHMQVMVTEIACIDRNFDNVVRFTVKVCNWMDQQPWVFEYGLFDFQRKVADNFVSPAAQLMDAKGNFTQLGNMYLHDQPMREPIRPHEADVSEGNNLHSLKEVPSVAPVPPQHGPEDEMHHGAPAETSNQSAEPVTNGIDGITASTALNGSMDALSMGSMNGSVISKAELKLDSDQAGALKIQNEGRRGKGLPLLSWDSKLASDAQKWAQHLVQIEKMVHSSSDQRPGEGENLAWAWSSGGITNPLTGGAQMWMNEAKDYHGEAIGQGDFEKYGHYTQCMWRSTTHVGMASAKDSKGAVYTVGRYSPPGNWTGQKPF